MRSFIVFVAALFLLSAACLAQPTIEWQKCLGGSSPDYVNSIHQTADSGFIVAGESTSNDGDVTGHYGPSLLSSDYWVVKLNSAGTIEWQKSLGGNSSDEAWSIQQTSDGGFIVAGESYSNDGDVSGNHGNYDYWIVKLDSVGNILWQKCLGGSDDDRAHSIHPTADGGFIVAGYSCSDDADVSGHHGSFLYPDYWVVKLDSIGDIIWQRSLGGTYHDWATSIHQTIDAGFIVAGYSYSNDGDVSGHHGSMNPDSLNPDYWVVKLDSAGTIEWQKSLGGIYGDYAYSIYQNTDSNFTVAGYSNSNDGDVSGNHGNYDYWILKLDYSGDIIWQKCLGGSSDEYASSIQQTSDGGFIVAGLSVSNDGDVSGNHGGGDYWVVKLGSAGALVWQRALGGSDYDKACSIQQTSDGGYIVAGNSESNDGDVSGNHGGGDDYWVVKLSSDTTVGISDDNKGLQPLAYTISAYPNPFNSSCEITLSCHSRENGNPEGWVEVKIYDLRGNVVYKTPSIPRSLSPQGERDDLAVEDGSESPSPLGEGFRMRYYLDLSSINWNFLHLFRYIS